MGKIRRYWGAETAENLCLGFGCWGKGFFAKVSGGFASGVDIIGEADGKAGLFAALLGLLAAADMASIQVDFFALQVQVAAGSQTYGLGIQFLSGDDEGIATDTADLG